MKRKLIFVEAFAPGFAYQEGEVVALNVEAAEALQQAQIPFRTISDLVAFESYLAHEPAYTPAQLQFFQDFDQGYEQWVDEEGVPFRPLHIYGYHYKIIIDALFSQALILVSILRGLVPEEVVLLGSYQPTKNIRYEQFSPVQRDYPYLNFEVLQHLTQHLGVHFHYRRVRPSGRDVVRALQAKLRHHIAASHLVKVYRHKTEPVKSELITEDLHFLEGARVLFNNRHWELDRVFLSVLKTNREVFLLDGYSLFVHEGGRLKQIRKVTRNALAPAKSPEPARPVPFLTPEHPFVALFEEALGFPCTALLQRRIDYLTTALVPGIFRHYRVAGKLLDGLGLDFVLDNAKAHPLGDALAYVASYARSCQYLYFTHGYDVYDVDRTFLELPCNVYYTLSEEYRCYFESKFRAQDFFMQPEKVAVGPMRIGAS